MKYFLFFKSDVSFFVISNDFGDNLLAFKNVEIEKVERNVDFLTAIPKIMSTNEHFQIVHTVYKCDGIQSRTFLKMVKP